MSAATVPTTEALAPLAASERIVALDVLRGFALVGIFIMNMPGFSHSLFAAPVVPSNALDAWTMTARDLLFAGKFNLLFGALFGIGFAIQMTRLDAIQRDRAARAEAAGRPRRAPAAVLRRLAFLLVVALVHATLLWSGDVLLVYAVLGFVLLAMRHASDRAIVAVVVLCLLFPAASEVLARGLLSAGFDTLAAFQYQQLQASNDLAFGHGSFVEAVRETARVFAWSVRTPLGLFSYLAFAVQMATGILTGYVVARRGWPARLARDGVPQSLLVATLAVAIAGNVLAAIGDRALRPGLGVDGAVYTVALARTLGRAALSAFYALAIFRLVGRGALPAWLRPLQQAGRMPLTNYLLQTLLGTFCFYGWGLGWWGSVGAAAETALAVALFLFVQLPFSVAWMVRHETGPLEALWRWFTYGARPP